MIGLSGSLSIAEGALSAQYAGLAVTNNNIANANTPGYSRQLVSLSSVAYDQNGHGLEAGVTYSGYVTVRDAVLNLAINAKNSEQSSLTAQSQALAPVNTQFAGTTTGIGASLSSLFASLSALSVTPSDAAARQTVLNTAGQLVNDFHRGATSLQSAAADADHQVSGTVAEINQLTSQIAELNGQLSQLKGSGQDGGSVQDQRDSLTTKLAQLTGIAAIQTDTTPTLTTTNGSLLVIGSTSYALQVTKGVDGKAHVLDSQGNDITSKLDGGTLGGALTVRDTTIAGLSQHLDTLASQFAAAMNAAQATGFDQNGTAGVPMFTVAATGSALSINLAITSGAQIAVSSSAGSTGSGNLNALLSVQSAALPSGATPTDDYAALAAQIGTATSTVDSQLTAATASLNQLTAQRDGESGVSLDQEAVNLVRYQQAYTAAAKVITTINSLYTTLMDMIR